VIRIHDRTALTIAVRCHIGGEVVCIRFVGGLVEGHSGNDLIFRQNALKQIYAYVDGRIGFRLIGVRSEELGVCTRITCLVQRDSQRPLHLWS